MSSSSHEALEFVALHNLPSERRAAVIEEAARLLESQWPRSGEASRIKHLARSSPDLPAHFVVLGGPSEVLGHCSLRTACDLVDGLAAVLCSVVVPARHRRRGIGRELVRRAEDEARRRGFAWCYLSTPDQRQFYERCGFELSGRVSTLSSVSRLLEPAAVTGLQALMVRKASAAGCSVSAELTAPDEVWLRKALVETLPFEPTQPEDDRRALLQGLPRASSPACLPAHVVVIDMTWERQVGPSCGLCALRILRRWLAQTGAPAVPTPTAERFMPQAASALGPESSLLVEAQRRGLSARGEMFDVRALAQLAADACGVPFAVVPLTDASVPSTLAAGLPALVAYDRDTNNQPTSQRGGSAAHWGVLRGVAVRQTATGDSDVAVLLSHGISRRPVVCTLADFLSSNASLQECAKPAADHQAGWIFPENGSDLSGWMLVPDVGAGPDIVPERASASLSGLGR